MAQQAYATVLVVSDDPNKMKALLHFLWRQGLRTVEADSIRSCLARIAENRGGIDIAIVDEALRESPGKLVSALRESGYDVPSIMLASDRALRNTEAFIRSGGGAVVHATSADARESLWKQIAISLFGAKDRRATNAAVCDRPIRQLALGTRAWLRSFLPDGLRQAGH